MSFTMDDIKKLRKKTGARIMDCKKALEEAKGDLKKAEAIVAAKGLARAEKSADRETKAGYVASYVHSNGMVASMVEVLCETDFVAQNDEFRSMSRNIAMQVVAMSPKNVKELLAQDDIKDSSQTVEDTIKALSGKIGEKMTVNRFERYEIGQE